jgi:hypothetical protein
LLGTLSVAGVVDQTEPAGEVVVVNGVASRANNLFFRQALRELHVGVQLLKGDLAISISSTSTARRDCSSEIPCHARHLLVAHSTHEGCSIWLPNISREGNSDRRSAIAQALSCAVQGAPLGLEFILLALGFSTLGLGFVVFSRADAGMIFQIPA